MQIQCVWIQALTPLSPILLTLKHRLCCIAEEIALVGVNWQFDTDHIFAMEAISFIFHKFPTKFLGGYF